MSKNKQTSFKTAIVGCGRIAHALDADSSDELVLTHAKAYSVCSTTELTGVCDTDAGAAKRCASAYGAIFFTDFRDMLEKCSPDIVSICTPDETHLDMLSICAEFPVKAVWCEKPVGTHGQNPEPVIRKLEQNSIVVAVNYMRRWEPEHVRIADAIRTGEYGSVTKILAYYSKGFIHSGSHFVDLFISWFGKPESWQVLGSVADSGDDDPALDILLHFPGSVKAYLLAGNVKHYSMDEIDVWAEKIRVRIADYSKFVHFRRPTFDDASGKCKLTEPVESRRTSYDRLMLTILESIVAAVLTGSALPSTGRTAVETLNLCENILAQYYRQSRNGN